MHKSKPNKGFNEGVGRKIEIARPKMIKNTLMDQPRLGQWRWDTNHSKYNVGDRPDFELPESTRDTKTSWIIGKAETKTRAQTLDSN